VLISLRGDAHSTPSAAGLEIRSSIALHHSILCMCGMSAVCLTLTVSVGADAIRAAHEQFRFPSLTGGEHGVLNLPLSISNQQVEFGSGCDVNGAHGVSVW
jgi:hypothetical protein